MDRNVILAFALSFLVLIAYSLYQVKEHPQPPPSQTASTESAKTGAKAPKQTAQESAKAEKGAQSPQPAAGSEAPPEKTRAQSAAGTPAAAAKVTVPKSSKEHRIQIQNQLFDAMLTSHGGGLLQWKLQKFDDASQPGKPLVEMVTPDQDRDVALATPFTGLGLGDWSKAPFAVSQPDANTVVFTREQGGVRVQKTYLFDPEHYLFRLRIQVENHSNRHVAPTFRVNWPAALQKSADYSEFSLGAYVDGHLKHANIRSGHSLFGFGGGAFSKVQEYPTNVDWAGAQTRYFLAALLPDDPHQAGARFTPAEPTAGRAALAEVAFQKADVPPGQGLDREYRVYIGPKEQDRLDTAGAHLDEAINRGWSWFKPLTRFFTWVLTATHSVIPNYGLAIILITIVVRLLMWPLMARQTRSMKRMATLAPRMKEIQAKYPDDKQKQAEAQMALYKETGVSPFSMVTGCLPMLLQMPIFLGFYYALLGAIQLRQQPFFGWIHDLSMPETIFVIPGLNFPVHLLPLLMGASTVLQQKITPTTGDAAQARMMMMIMPVFLTVIMYPFASGLVLYWFMSTLLGVVQQFITNREAT